MVNLITAEIFADRVMPKSPTYDFQKLDKEAVHGKVRRFLKVGIEKVSQALFRESGLIDSGLIDSGLIDSGLIDSGLIDSGLTDAGLTDSGLI